MRKFLIMLALILIASISYAQYANMVVISPKDMAFCSIKNFDEDILVMDKQGYLGVFVDVASDSKVKLTVSAKGVEQNNNLPLMRFSSGDVLYKNIVSSDDFNDYSCNFSLPAGRHFLKIENMPFPKSNYPLRKLFIKRIYISGNNVSVIKDASSKDVLDVCNNYIKNNRMLDVSVLTKLKTGKSAPSSMNVKINNLYFDYGLCVTEADIKNRPFMDAMSKKYNLFVNDLQTDYINPIGDYTSGLVAEDDLYAEDLSDQVYEMLKNNVNIETIRLECAGNSNKEDLVTLFAIFQSLNIYGLNIQLYNYAPLNNNNTSTILGDVITVCLGNSYVRGMVLSEGYGNILVDDVYSRNPNNIDGYALLFDKYKVPGVIKSNKTGQATFKVLPGEYEIKVGNLKHIIKVTPKNTKFIVTI